MENAEKLSITLTPHLAKLVRDSVASGRFTSASEVIRDAMRVQPSSIWMKFSAI